MALVDRFSALVQQLPDDWETARVRLMVQDDGDCARAAALLGPLNPGRYGKAINFVTTRRGGGIGPDRIRSLLRRIDAERIAGTMSLLETTATTETPGLARQSLAAAWDEALTTLPADWSDAFVEVEVDSSDYVEPGALRLSPLNPLRVGDRPAFRFRVARRFGYGGSPEMGRRCFERLDEAAITGRLTILNAFSDTDPVKTQGPVIYSLGRPT